MATTVGRRAGQLPVRTGIVDRWKLVDELRPGRRTDRAFSCIGCRPTGAPVGQLLDLAPLVALLGGELLDPLLDEPDELDGPGELGEVEPLDVPAEVLDSLAAVLPASEDDDEPVSDLSDLSLPPATVLAAPDRESVR